MIVFEESAPIGILMVERQGAGGAARIQVLDQFTRLKFLSVLDRVEAAIDWLSQHVPDVLVTDLELSDGSGLAIINECARRHPACKILVLVSSKFGHAIHTAIEAGASGFLLRDATDGCVVSGVMSMLAGGCPISALVARQLFDRCRSTFHLGTALDKSSKGAKKVNLTQREIQVLQHMARGDLYEEISAALGITLGTLQSHVKNLYRKLDVHSRSEAIFRSHEHGILRYLNAQE